MLKPDGLASVFCALALLCAGPLTAQQPGAQQDEATNPAETLPAPSNDPALTMFPHSQTARWWVSGQSNIIMQWHPGFVICSL
jgi:high affinity Mn2+ porin